jgi:hypothetical protein
VDRRTDGRKQVERMRQTKGERENREGTLGRRMKGRQEGRIEGRQDRWAHGRKMKRRRRKERSTREGRTQ